MQEKTIDSCVIDDMLHVLAIECNLVTVLCVLQGILLNYEVTYNLKPQAMSKLIYRGMNAEIEFMLPAGDASNNYTGKFSVI